MQLLLLLLFGGGREGQRYNNQSLFPFLFLLPVAIYNLNTDRGISVLRAQIAQDPVIVIIVFRVYER